MASNAAPVQSHVASVQLPSEFKTEYHPRSGRSTIYQTFDEFGIAQETQDAPIDEEPWHPFRSRGDFEFSEIALDAALNKSQINALLGLISRISQGQAQITLKSETDLSKAWDNAAAELTPVSLTKTAYMIILLNALDDLLLVLKARSPCDIQEERARI